MLIESPIVAVSDIAARCKVSYPTARTDTDRLIELGILSPVEAATHPKYYSAREVFQVAYRED
jgi:Fic family protein